MTSVDDLWPSTEPLDRTAGAEWTLTRVATVFGEAPCLHHGSLFANLRADRRKVLVRDGIDRWPDARRLAVGSFAWPRGDGGIAGLSRPRFNALMLGPPWHRLRDAGMLRVMSPEPSPLRHAPEAPGDGRRNDRLLNIKDVERRDADALWEKPRASRAELALKQTVIRMPTHGNAALKRPRSAARPEVHIADQHCPGEMFDASQEAFDAEMEAPQAVAGKAAPKRVPRREPLPENLPRRVVHPSPPTRAAGV